MRRMLALPILCLILIALAVPAFAESTIGFRAGMAIDPDEFVIGIHFRTDPISEKSLFIVPSFEAGFGDATMIAINGDLHWVFDLESKLDPYIGGGVTVNWFDTDNGNSDTEVGGSVLGGLMLGQTDLGRMFLELKLGLGDVPDAKILVGWNLH
jgi:opacity protein-like surface antigen